MKKLMLVLALLAISSAAQAAMVAEWSFSGNLNDSATGGSTADNLVGMMQYPGHGNFDHAFTNYKKDGTTEAIASCVQAPTYQAGGLIGGGTAARIGARGVYNYTGDNTYPDASTYQVPAVGATFLQTTSDSAGSDLDLQSGSFTMEGFFKADAVGSLGVENSGLGEFAYTRLLTKWVSGFNQNFHFTIHNSKLEIIQKNSMGGAVTVASTDAVAPEAGKWFYVAAVGDAETETIGLYFYVKDALDQVVGGLVGSGVYDGSMYDSTSPFYIGGRLDVPNSIASNNGFIGLVDEVRLWDEAKGTDYLITRAGMIPEPATMSILALGGLLLRRKK